MDKNIDSKTLAIEIAKILDKKKAQDVRVLKVDSLTVLTDYFVIASGTSTTQVGSLADEVEYELSQSGIEPHTTEGFDSKNWVLLDYSSVIVHVFVPNTRTYYDLEHLWADGEPIDISEYLTPDNSPSYSSPLLAIYSPSRLTPCHCPGCGTQHPLRSACVVLAAAPTTTPCFRHWRRSSLLLLTRGGFGISVNLISSPEAPLDRGAVERSETERLSTALLSLSYIIGIVLEKVWS